MSRILKVSAIALLAVLTLAPMASAQRGGRFGGGHFGGGFRVRGGFGFYGPGYYGFGYGPYWGGYWGYPYGYYYGGGSGAGEIKIETPSKDALVYVDGGYAGLSGKLRHFNLAPGTHDIELRDPSGKTFFQEHVQVIPGKTIDIGHK
jgi:hypothetical protein